MRRNDPASSRHLSSFFLFFHSFLFERPRPRGRNIVLLSIVFSKHERTRFSRHDANSWLARERIGRSRDSAIGKKQGTKIDREIATEKRGANKRGETRDLIIGQACTLTNFRERVVKGAEKPESRRAGEEEEEEGTWEERGRERDGPRVNLDERLLAAAAVETRGPKRVPVTRNLNFLIILS